MMNFQVVMRDIWRISVVHGRVMSGVVFGTQLFPGSTRGARIHDDFRPSWICLKLTSFFET